MPPIVKVSGLVKRYDGFTAVNGVDFEITKGECFGLLGPNGAGKTTTVKTICCILPLTEGEIIIDGLSARECPREIKARIGVCHQEPNLDPDFSVFKNLTVYSRYFDIPAEEARTRAVKLIEQFHLHDKLDRPIDDLSGGLKKRLLVARALVNNPSIVILDEPTTGLDPQSKHQIWDEIGKMKSRGTTVVLTTHYMEEAFLLCDRLIIMDKGKIIESGSPRGLIEKHIGAGGTLEEVFLKLTGRQLRE